MAPSAEVIPNSPNSIRDAADNYSIRTLRTWDELREVEEFWRGATWHPNAEFEFFSMICSGRSEIQQPYVIVVSKQAQPVLLLAGRLEKRPVELRFGYGNLGRITATQLLIVEGGVMGDFTEAMRQPLFAYLVASLKADDIDSIRFDYLRVESEFFRAAISTPSIFRRDWGLRPALHWKLQIPSSLAEFLGQKKKKHRYWLNRLRKRLEEEFPGKVRFRVFTAPTEAAEFCADAEQIAASSYHRQIGAGFIDNAENRERLLQDAARGRMRGYIAYLDDKPRAFWCGSLYRGTFHLAWTAYVPEFRQYELGTVLFLEMVDDLSKASIKEIDMGLGTALYKERFGDQNWKEAPVYIYSLGKKGVLLNLATTSVNRMASLSERILGGTFATRLKSLWRRRLIGAGQGDAGVAS